MPQPVLRRRSCRSRVRQIRCALRLWPGLSRRLRCSDAHPRVRCAHPRRTARNHRRRRNRPCAQCRGARQAQALAPGSLSLQALASGSVSLQVLDDGVKSHCAAGGDRPRKTFASEVLFNARQGAFQCDTVEVQVEVVAEVALPSRGSDERAAHPWSLTRSARTAAPYKLSVTTSRMPRLRAAERLSAKCARARAYSPRSRSE